MPDDVVGGEAAAVHPANLAPETPEKNPQNPNGAGRHPIYEITAELITKVENYAIRGLNKQQICGALGISDDTLANYEKKSSELSDAIKAGKAKGIAHYADQLLKQADNGNIAATIFYLKSQAGWKDINVLQVETLKPLIIELTPSGGNGNGHDKSE